MLDGTSASYHSQLQLIRIQRYWYPVDVRESVYLQCMTLHLALDAEQQKKLKVWRRNCLSDFPLFSICLLVLGGIVNRPSDSFLMENLMSYPSVGNPIDLFLS